MFKPLVTLAAVAAIALPAQAVTVVQWDFQLPPADLSNSTTSPTVSASTGTGVASGLHASSATDWSTPAGNGSSDSFSSNTWATGDYWQFSFATVGYSGLTVSFDQTRSGTGPDAFKLSYSTDGGANFNDFANYTVASVTWNSTTAVTGSTYSFDLSGVTALDNQSAVVLRLVSTVTPAAGGTNRIDNFTVMTTAVPEPGTWALMFAGVAGVAFIARRRKD